MSRLMTPCVARRVRDVAASAANTSFGPLGLGTHLLTKNDHRSSSECDVERRMLFARAKRRPSFSLQSRDRQATHDPTAIHSARHDASKKEVRRTRTFA